VSDMCDADPAFSVAGGIVMAAFVAFLVALMLGSLLWSDRRQRRNNGGGLPSRSDRAGWRE
jgi:hypothetical protein